MAKSRGPVCMQWAGLEGLEPELRRYLRRRCRDQNEVDDVVQETLLRAARYRPSLMATERIGGWAQRIACNVLRDRQRHEGRLRRIDFERAGVDRMECAAPDDFGDREQTVRVGGRTLELGVVLQHLERALGRLRAGDRDVLRSFYGGDGDTARAARELGVARRLIKVRLYRARRRLGSLLRQSLSEAPLGPSMDAGNPAGSR